jgi:uncharacterized protein (TIGR02996 family)
VCDVTFGSTPQPDVCGGTTLVTEEIAFLAAVEANPSDELPRLVFADWLEDRGDPRAGWVRDPNLWKWMTPGTIDPFPRLIAALMDDDFNVYDEAREGCSAIGVAAVPVLLDMLRDADPAKRRGGAKGLGYGGAVGSDAVAQLLQTLKDSDTEVRWRSASALGKVGAEEVVPSLIEALQDSSYDVRNAAARACGDIGTAAQQAVPALLQTLANDDDRDVRQQAAVALGRVGPESETVLLALADALRSEDDFVCIGALEALQQIGPRATAAVSAIRDVYLRDVELSMTTQSGSIVKETASEALWKIGAAAVPALVDSLAPEYRLLYIHTLPAIALIGPEAVAAVPTLIALLAEEDVDVRTAAAMTLGHIGPGAITAVPSLEQMTGEGDEELSAEAQNAINRILATDAA